VCHNRSKRAVILLFALILVLHGCRSTDNPSTVSDIPVEESSIRVLIDLDVTGNILSPSAEEALKQFIESEDGYQSFTKTVKSLGGPAQLKLEFPPVSGERRDAYLTGLRTEIMAGKGPDVFICAGGPSYVMDYTQMQDGGISGNWESPLFPFPQQAMKRNTFLCLDEYIKDFQFSDCKNFAPAIMEAGKYEDKQYLLPMSYTMPVTIFKESDVQHTHTKDMTWQDMLDDSPELQAVAVMDSSIYMSTAFMSLTDSDKDELPFSEQELLEFMTEKIHMERELVSSNSASDYSSNILSLGFDKRLAEDVFPPEEPLTMIPCYSQQGGYVATVTSFVAVNANTEYPKAAAFLADYVLSEDCQKSVLYSYILGTAVPIMDSLLQEGKGLKYLDKSWGLSQKNYDEFCSLRDDIARAEFSTQLNIEFQRLYVEIMDSADKKSIESLVHDAYMRMSMELAES
jgi:ABC-type glycerol-3-phosphate transport system substrate-binding protein